MVELVFYFPFHGRHSNQAVRFKSNVIIKMRENQMK